MLQKVTLPLNSGLQPLKKQNTITESQSKTPAHKRQPTTLGKTDIQKLEQKAIELGEIKKLL